MVSRGHTPLVHIRTSCPFTPYTTGALNSKSIIALVQSLPFNEYVVDEWEVRPKTNSAEWDKKYISKVSLKIGFDPKKI